MVLNEKFRHMDIIFVGVESFDDTPDVIPSGLIHLPEIYRLSLLILPIAEMEKRDFWPIDLLGILRDLNDNPYLIGIQ